jgi:D-tyrosyl-tRNA(Tyr) deacylase
VQRAAWARVTVDDKTVGEIGTGLVVLLGIKRGDQLADGENLMDKVLNLRIFEDEVGKMNRSLLEVGGEILLISQFTLYGDARKGRRPSFTEAEDPIVAQSLFGYCMNWVAERGVKIATGSFGADMKVQLVNDGPCTILLDSEKKF